MTTVTEIEAILRPALERIDVIEAEKLNFIADNETDGGDPKCGYADWDETITDFNYELADAGGYLADAVRKALGTVSQGA